MHLGKISPYNPSPFPAIPAEKSKKSKWNFPCCCKEVDVDEGPSGKERRYGEALKAPRRNMRVAEQKGRPAREFTELIMYHMLTGERNQSVSGIDGGGQPFTIGAAIDFEEGEKLANRVFYEGSDPEKKPIFLEFFPNQKKGKYICWRLVSEGGTPSQGITVTEESSHFTVCSKILQVWKRQGNPAGPVGKPGDRGDVEGGGLGTERWALILDKIVKEEGGLPREDDFLHRPSSRQGL